MTYAKRLADQWLDIHFPETGKDPMTHESLEALLYGIIERCAQEAEAHGRENMLNIAALRAADRIRSLATSEQP